MERRKVVVSAFIAIAMAFIILIGVAFVNIETINVLQISEDLLKISLNQKEETYDDLKTSISKNEALLLNSSNSGDTSQTLGLTALIKNQKEKLAELEKEIDALKNDLEALFARKTALIAFSWIQFIVEIACCALATDQLIYEATSRILCTISAIMSTVSVFAVAVIHLVLFAAYELPQSISYAIVFAMVVMLAVIYWLKYENRKKDKYLVKKEDTTPTLR